MLQARTNIINTYISDLAIRLDVLLLPLISRRMPRISRYRRGIFDLNVAAENGGFTRIVQNLDAAISIDRCDDDDGTYVR